MLQIVNRKLNKAYQDFDINFLRSFLPFAQGRFLDYIGDMLNVVRIGANRAVVLSTHKIFKVYVTTGTFGSLNSGNPILIPTGTIFSTLPLNEGISYTAIEGVLLDPAATEAFISIEASKDGAFSNTGPGTIRFTTFNNYTAGTGLLFTNPGVINTGRELESDTNYRFRISNQALTSEKANQTAVRLALLVVPGVSDLISIPYARGIGTFDYLIQTVVPNTPDPVIEACQVAISSVQAHGIDGRAVKPRLTGMSFQIDVTWRNDVKLEDRDSIKRNIVSAIQDHINNLDIGQEFILNKLIQIVFDVDTRIKNIGTSDDPITNISIFRESKVRDNSLKEELIDNFFPDTNERLIIEPSLETPIVIVDLN